MDARIRRYFPEQPQSAIPTKHEEISSTVSTRHTNSFLRAGPRPVQGAYNHCDFATLSAIVADDLEFYHDQTGLPVRKAPFIAAIKQNIGGKVERTLLPGSMEMYPLKGYGAVDIGVHRFHHPAHPENGEGEAKFITLWQNRDGTWKVMRAISYTTSRSESRREPKLRHPVTRGPERESERTISAMCQLTVTGNVAGGPP